MQNSTVLKREKGRIIADENFSEFLIHSSSKKRTEQSISIIVFCVQQRSFKLKQRGSIPQDFKLVPSDFGGYRSVIFQVLPSLLTLDNQSIFFLKVEAISDFVI